MNYPININKFISYSGLTSRRQADVLVKTGKVKINGKLAKLIDKVNKEDNVIVEGKLISHSEPRKIYLAFNKPVGVISTTDFNSPNNIIEAVKYPARLFPIGRLDVNTSGLILLTNDGSIVNKILKGAQKVEKEYEVEVTKTIKKTFLPKLERGVYIEGFLTLPAKTRKISEKVFRIIIVEGKKRQVKRMCEAFEYEVAKLKRIRIAKLTLEGIAEGKYKELSRDKIRDLFGF